MQSAVAVAPQEGVFAAAKSVVVVVAVVALVVVVNDVVQDVEVGLCYHRRLVDLVLSRHIPPYNSSPKNQMLKFIHQSIINQLIQIIWYWIPN